MPSMELVERQALVDWLIANGVDEVGGYGHVSADDLADQMLKTWTIGRPHK